MEGEIIVARECLVDGEVQADSLDELFTLRASFISNNYGACTVEEYLADSKAEFDKILAIPKGANAYLWFEDDLFCQVNFWFVCYLLHIKSRDLRVHLVRPPVHTPFGFGGLDNDQLITAFQNATPLSQISEIAQLWVQYQSGDLDGLKLSASKLRNTLPFIEAAVDAHLLRILVTVTII